MATEVCFPAFEAKAYPRVSYNLPFHSACANHLDDKEIGAKRVYLLASGSLFKGGENLERLKKTLGEKKLVGIRKGIKPHTYWSEVLEVVMDVSATDADVIITFGGGSLTDTAKVVTLAVANDVSTINDLETLVYNSPRKLATLKPATIPIICIPTTLSGGECTSIAGATNDETKHKEAFVHPSMIPRLVILDPELCRTTPLSVWLSTGIRAVDHCVETICSIQPREDSDRDAKTALRRLIPGLLGTQIMPNDNKARLQTQLGVVEAMKAVSHGVTLGASHGIGHQLGPFNVGHGETSCILLPAVMKYNSSVNGGQQKLVLDVIWDEPKVALMLREEGLAVGKSDLGDVLHTFVKKLGLPRSLRDVGVENIPLQQLAASSLKDKWCQTNLRPLEEASKVLEILKMII